VSTLIEVCFFIKLTWSTYGVIIPISLSGMPDCLYFVAILDAIFDSNLLYIYVEFL